MEAAGLGGDSAFRKSDLGMPSTHVSHQSSFYHITCPPFPRRCERETFRHLDGEIERPLWAGVRLKSYLMRGHLSPYNGRSG